MRSKSEVIHDIRLGLMKAKVNAEVLGKIEPQYAVPMQKFIEGIEELGNQFAKDVLDTLRIG